MRIASFNANGIRPRLPILVDWLGKVSPDVLCIQETKVQDHEFPRRQLEDAGYHCAFIGQKSYNGVAILSKTAPDLVRVGFEDGEPEAEARLITASVAGIAVVNTYVPQGQDPASEKFRYKMEWFSRLLRYFEARFTPESLLVWAGDLNVAPLPLDVYDPDTLLGSVGYHPEEHRALSRVTAWGFQDVFRKHKPDAREYTFWDYRIPNAVKRGLGWRVDHVMATGGLAEKSRNAWIDKEPRLMERPSDHTFIVAEFDL